MPNEIDSPEYAKALEVLKAALPEGTDPLVIWSALQDAGLTISETDTPPAEGTPPESAAATTPPVEAAPSGAPIEGEPTGVGGGLAGMNIGNGPPTDDMARKAFQAALAEHAAAKQ